MTTTPGQALRAAMDAFTEKQEGALPALLALYDEGVEFLDPLVHTHGREELADALRKLFVFATRLTVECGDLVESQDTIFLAWKMTLVTRLGPALTLPGVTHARTRDGKVIWQRDHWDLASTVAHAFPGGAAIYRRMTAFFT